MLTPDNSMYATHHDLDIKPIPEQVLYINEPGIAGDFVAWGYLTWMTHSGLLRWMTLAKTHPGMQSNRWTISASLFPLT